MFESTKDYSRYLAASSLLSRLNRALFLMVVDSAHPASASGCGASIQTTHSTFIVPNQ